MVIFGRAGNVNTIAQQFSVYIYFNVFTESLLLGREFDFKDVELLKRLLDKFLLCCFPIRTP